MKKRFERFTVADSQSWYDPHIVLVPPNIGFALREKLSGFSCDWVKACTEDQ